MADAVFFLVVEGACDDEALHVTRWAQARPRGLRWLALRLCGPDWYHEMLADEASVFPGLLLIDLVDHGSPLCGGPDCEDCVRDLEYYFPGSA